MSTDEAEPEGHLSGAQKKIRFTLPLSEHSDHDVENCGVSGRLSDTRIRPRLQSHPAAAFVLRIPEERPPASQRR